MQSDGVERTRELAAEHIAHAIAHARRLHQPDPIEALVAVAHKVASRNK